MAEGSGPLRARTGNGYETVTVSELTVEDTTKEAGTSETTMTEQDSCVLIRNGVRPKADGVARVDWAETGRGSSKNAMAHTPCQTGMEIITASGVTIMSAGYGLVTSFVHQSFNKV